MQFIEWCHLWARLNQEYLGKFFLQWSRLLTPMKPISSSRPIARINDINQLQARATVCQWKKPLWLVQIPQTFTPEQLLKHYCTTLHPFSRLSECMQFCNTPTLNRKSINLTHQPSENTNLKCELITDSKCIQLQIQLCIR